MSFGFSARNFALLGFGGGGLEELPALDVFCKEFDAGGRGGEAVIGGFCKVGTLFLCDVLFFNSAKKSALFGFGGGG